MWDEDFVGEDEDFKMRSLWIAIQKEMSRRHYVCRARTQRRV